MRIVVTQEDIDSANHGAVNCPIARSVKRIMRHPHSVTASRERICLHDEAGYYAVRRFIPSQRAIAFMNRFDDGGRSAVKPSVFICPEKF